MHILIINDTLDLNKELERLSNETGHSCEYLLDCWKNTRTNQTISGKPSNIIIEDLQPKEKDYQLPKKISYKAQQRSIPKFLR